MLLLSKVTYTNERLSSNNLQVYIYECEEIKVFNVTMEIFCYTQIDELMHSRVLCSQVIFIIQRMS